MQVSVLIEKMDVMRKSVTDRLKSNLTLVALLVILLSSKAWASECQGRLPDGFERIYVVQDGDSDVGWTSHLDGGFTTHLKTSAMSEINPVFSNDDG